MSKICPNCKREIDENVKFCPFCAAFTGETPQEKKKSPVGAIIGGAAGVLALGAASLAVFVFDIFGMYGEKTETLYGTGDKLFIQSVTPVCIDGKWGYADKSGSTTLKPQYSAAYAFNEDTNDVAPVAVDGKFGYIKKDGEFVAQPQYSFTGSFSDKGLAKVTDENGNVGFVDSRGRKAFDGRMFSYASDMNDSGYAFAYTLMMPELEGRSYYDIIYSLLSSDGKVTELANGTGISAIYDDKYIGFRQAESSNETTLDFTREYAVFSADGTQLTDYYDRIVKSGKLLIVCDGIDDDSKLYKAKLLKADTLEQVGGEYLCGSDIKSYDSGAVLLKRDDKGFIRDVLLCDNANEIYLCSTGSHIVSGFDMSGYACVYEKGKYCGYTASGKQFESDNQFGSFNCGLAPYYDNAKIGYINTNGEKVTDAQYDGASGYYADGYAYVKSGTEYSVIDMSGNTVIGRLSYASDKLMFADTVHSWYDPEDFEKFDGENMFQGDFYYVGNNADMNNSIFGRSNIKPLTERMVVKSRNPDVDIAFDYRRTDSGKLGNDGYILTHEINKSTHLLMSPDGKVNKEDEMNNANVICIDSAPVIRYCDDTTTYLADIFGNKYVVSGYNLINSNGCTALDLRNGNRVARQILIYDNSFMPSVDIHSQTSMNITDLGDLLYVKNIRNGNEENNNAIIDKWNGRTLYTIYNADFISDYFISKPDVYKEIDDDYIVDETDMYTVYTVSTSYGVNIGTYPYVKAYGDRVLCFDYDKYYLYDRYANLLGEYENRPKISAYNGNTVVKNDDGTYTCYDRDMNVLLTTKYDIQPIENGYCSFADNQKGLIGFLSADGKTVIEPKYHCVTGMTPDGYFVSRTANHAGILESGDCYADYTAAIENRNGETVVKTESAVSDIANSITDSKSLYSYFDGNRYYTDKFSGCKSINFNDIEILPDTNERRLPSDFYGNELFEEYKNVALDYSAVQINGDTICVEASCYINDEIECRLLGLNGERLYRNGRKLQLINGGYVLGVAENGQPAVLYNSDGSVMLTLEGVTNSYDISYIERVDNKLLVSGDSKFSAIYDLTTGEILYKLDKETTYLHFVYKNLISVSDYDSDNNSLTSYVDLDTKKSFELPGDRVVFRNSGNNSEGHITENAEYPLMCCTFSYLPNQINYLYLYTALLELNVYQIDENMEVKLVRTYSSDDGILYMVDDYNSGSGLYAYIDRIDDTAVRNIRLVNAWNGNEKYFENVSEFSVQDNEVWIGIYDESGKRTAYKLSTDLETMEQAE